MIGVCLHVIQVVEVRHHIANFVDDLSIVEFFADSLGIIDAYWGVTCLVIGGLSRLIGGKKSP